MMGYEDGMFPEDPTPRRGCTMPEPGTNRELRLPRLWRKKPKPAPGILTEPERERLIREVREVRFAELQRAHTALNAEHERLRRQLGEYENCITWDTTCKQCAHTLDASIQEHERAEQAEARIRELEAVATAMLDQFTEYVDEGHAYMCSREVGTTVINAWRATLVGDRR